MKEKIIVMMLLTSVLNGCTYFQVKDAIKEANKGNYLSSVQNLSNILRENGDDRRTLDAFEVIYPDAEKRYYDEIEANRNYDIKAYTKAMINLLNIENIYFNLPEASKKQMSLINPPLEERNELRKEIAESFYKLGNSVTTNNYLSKLKAYGYYDKAQAYNILYDKNIKNSYLKSKSEAEGKFFIDMDNRIGNTYIPTQLKADIESDINKYPIFTAVNLKDSNLTLKVTLTDMYYNPPATTVKTGTDSYTDTRERTVMKRVSEKRVVDGKEITVTSWIPTTIEEDYDVYYRFEKYTKSTSFGYQLTYTISEKNGNIIYTDSKNIVAKDEVKWTKYFPYRPYVFIDSFKFPRSEAEKYTQSENELMNLSIKAGAREVNKMVNRLYSNTEAQL